MNWFRLDPCSIVERVKASGSTEQAPTLGQSVLRGMVGFTIVSVAGFMPWVLAGKWFYHNPGELVMYSSCAVVFIGLSGLLLHPLIIGPESLKRFYILFTVAFAAYALAWIAGWMGLKGFHTHVRSAVGLFAGTLVMGAIFAIAFEARSQALAIISALFVLNALGYFVGGWIEGALAQQKTLNLFIVTLNDSSLTVFMKATWGVCYGLGFGAALGIAFYTAQSKARAMLKR